LSIFIWNLQEFRTTQSLSIFVLFVANNVSDCKNTTFLLIVQTFSLLLHKKKILLRPMREDSSPDGATDDKDEPENIRQNGRKQPVHYAQGRNATHKHGGTQAKDTVKTR